MAINREAEKALKLAEKVQMEQQAKILTKEKQDKIQEIQQILLTGLKFKGKDGGWVWNKLKDTTVFLQPEFTKQKPILKTIELPIPPKPSIKQPRYIELPPEPQIRHGGRKPKIEFTEEEISEFLMSELKKKKDSISIIDFCLYGPILWNGNWSWGGAIIWASTMGLISPHNTGIAASVTILVTYHYLVVFLWKLYSKRLTNKFLEEADRKMEEWQSLNDGREQNYQEKHKEWKNAIFEINNKNEQIKLNADLEYKRLVKEWEEEVEKIIQKNAELKKQAEIEFQKQLDEWNKEKDAFQDGIASSKNEFCKIQAQKNADADELYKKYTLGDPGAVVYYCGEILNNSAFPNDFSREFKLDYSPESKMLAVEYTLPSIDQYPTIEEVRYVATKNELRNVEFSETKRLNLFDITCYNIALKVLFELFVTDIANVVDTVTFNGWIHSINKATGNQEYSCILSIQVRKGEFMKIDLANVDPRLCFKGLKGVGSSKLSGITPIQPILQLNREDKRFVSGYNVSDGVNEGVNLAEMDWEDFENLIREIFEKEFSANGGEVKITQASRDGGVDAIVFDPDPIRGGKIVIQAKRYTNTVGVSAIRDLFGTVNHEGANTGIIVTTSNYGPDAYEFAKGKPLKLMSGGHLLALLEKHGHSARIDLREAKQNLYGK